MYMPIGTVLELRSRANLPCLVNLALRIKASLSTVYKKKNILIFDITYLV